MMSQDNDRGMNQRLQNVATSLEASNNSNESNVESIIQKLGTFNSCATATAYLKLHHPEFLGSKELYFAFEKEDLKVFQILLAHGADYTLKNQQGLTILHTVLISIRNLCLVGRLTNSFIDAILKAQVEDQQTANPCDPNGLSHFHAACMTNNVKAVEFFLDNGVSINDEVHSDSPNFPSYTPLHFAVRYFSFQVVEVLLKRGASIHHRDDRRMTPLHLLLERNLRMFNVDSYSKPFVQEERDLSEKITRQLLQNIANKDEMIIDDTDLSCLHVASAMMNLMDVDQLLKKTQNINHCINIESPLWPGYSALHFAAICNINVLKLLVKRGADLLAKNGKGVTPLDLCLERYKTEDIHDILSLNPSWKNIVFLDGKTKLLDLVAAMRSSDCFRKFQRRISKTKIISLPNDSPLWPGFTPMHLVVLFSKSTNNRYSHRKVGESHLEMISELHNRNMKAIETQDIHGRTPLHLCFWLGDMNNVANLLLELHQKLVNPLDLVDKDDLSLLHIACATKNRHLNYVDLIEKLLSHTKNANLAYKGNSIERLIIHGWTPLHMAVAKKQNSNVIRALLKYDANVNARDVNGITPIHFLAIANFYWDMGGDELDTDHILLSSPHLEEGVAEDIGLSHLHIACLRGKAEAVKKLINNGADINRTIKYLPEVYDDICNNYASFLSKFAHHTPLQMALKSSRRENDIVVFLIKRGADVLVKKVDGTSLLYDVVKRYNTSFAEHLRENTALQTQLRTCIGSMSELHFACVLNDSKLVRQLLKDGADVNATISLDSPVWPGCTPLHIFMNHPQHDKENISSILKLLLDNGADVNAKISSDAANLPGCTPLLIFMQNVQLKEENIDVIMYVLELLLDNGADVNAKIGWNSSTRPGCTALHICMCSICALYGDQHINKVSKLLLDRKADVTLANAKGRTPLHMAYQHFIMQLYYSGVREPTLPCLRMMLGSQKDFSVNPASVEGITHFHIACSLAEVATVEEFLKCGKINIDQPIDFHFNNERDFKHFPGAGCTPLHLAVMTKNNDKEFIEFKSQLETVDLLLKHGVDANAKNSRGETPFHIAICFELRERLARGGADVHAEDAKGQTALESLTIKPRFEPSGIINFLRLGCRFNTFNCQTGFGCIGQTTLTLSFAEMQKLMSKAIMDFPKTMETDESGRTVIHNFVSMRRLYSWSVAEYAILIEQLASAKCDIDDQDGLGRTALHFAVIFQNLKAISGLLLAGADINKTNIFGETAFAQINRFQPCVRCDQPTDAEDEQCQHYKLFKILALHIKKLQFCGLEVRQSNENIAATAFPDFKPVIVSEQFINELEEIKIEKVGSYPLTLRDFMSELDAVASYPTMLQEKKTIIGKMLHPSESHRLHEKYSEIVGLLKLQYRKALVRPKLIEKSKIYLNALVGFEWPDICSQMILLFLTNSDLICMIKAVED